MIFFRFKPPWSNIFFFFKRHFTNFFHVIDFLNIWVDKYFVQAFEIKFTAQMTVNPNRKKHFVINPQNIQFIVFRKKNCIQAYPITYSLIGQLILTILLKSNESILDSERKEWRLFIFLLLWTLFHIETLIQKSRSVTS